MNFKRFHESKNLFDLTAYYDVDSGISNINIDNGNITYNARSQYLAIKYKFSLAPTDVFTISLGSGSEKVQLELRYRKNGSAVGSMILIAAGNHLVITGDDAYDEFTIFISNATNTGICKASNIMLNTGSQPLPYEPYSSEVWHDTPHYLRGTDTDTLTLPQTIYGDGTNATLTIKGNIGGVGDLVSEGEHAGEYVIPIINNGVTTNIYNATALGISDSLTTTLATTDGANTLSIGTTVQPSEVTANYHGWHPVQSVHEHENGQWD